MSYYIIIRGSAGIGKTVVAKKLAKHLKAYRVSFDGIMKKHGLDNIKGSCISKRNFIEANKLVISRASKKLEEGIVVIFDGCFYHKSQIEHLARELKCRGFVFTLKASLKECISRDNKRKNKIGEESVKAVYKLVSRFDYGTTINTNGKTEEEVMKKILSFLPK
jgi:predicted kinase